MAIFIAPSTAASTDGSQDRPDIERVAISQLQHTWHTVATFARFKYSGLMILDQFTYSNRKPMKYVLV
jgi:hypothetical protein